MTTQTPRPGEIWRHYKSGKHCSVLGVSKPCHPVDVRAMGGLYVPMFADTKRTITVYGIAESEDRWHLRSRYGFPIFADSLLVSYACSGNLWVRSVSQFCEKFSLVVFDKGAP
jgi:hypothetical protein